MECMSTMAMKLEHQERWKASLLTRQISKWFYDTSIGTAWSSPLWFSVGVGLDHSSSSYGGTRWT
jgi:hypothetical protein